MAFEIGWLATLAWAEGEFCTVFIRRNLSIARFRRGNPRWLFSQWLFSQCPIVAQVDATLEQQILDVPERWREPLVHHDHQPGIISGDEWK